MQQVNANYCLCGCGQIAKNRFVRFHHLKQIHKSMVGKKRTDEVKKKLSISKRGISTITPEGKKAISEKAKQRWRNSAYRKHMSSMFKKKVGEKNPFFGKHHTDESKKKFLANRYFCKGEEHHWFKPNRKRQYPLEWRDTLKRAIRERDNYKCQICGVPQEECFRQLDVHHRDGNKDNCNPKNLISLCVSCHMKLEKNCSIGPSKIPETAGNPERAIRSQAQLKFNWEGSETIMGTPKGDGIVRHSEESEKTDAMAITLHHKEVLK